MADRRKLRVRYGEYDAIEWGQTETRDGYYVCEVQRCHGEGRRRFRQRVRALQRALETHPNPLLTTSPEE